MKKARLEALVLSASVLWVSAGAGCALLQAQEVVHAVTGVVTAVAPAENSITIKTNDGSEGVFHYKKDAKVDIEFDKDVRNGTAAPSAFNKVGDHVVAYYFGEGLERTVVAIKDFGASPLEVATGTVVKAKHHAIVLKTDSGATETFDIAKDASAETPQGVVGGFKLDVDSGTRATVRYTDENGLKVAQFIRTD
jgi:phosphotransferase system IIA component